MVKTNGNVDDLEVRVGQYVGSMTASILQTLRDKYGPELDGAIDILYSRFQERYGSLKELHDIPLDPLMKAVLSLIDLGYFMAVYFDKSSETPVESLPDYLSGYSHLARPTVVGWGRRMADTR